MKKRSAITVAVVSVAIVLSAIGVLIYLNRKKGVSYSKDAQWAKKSGTLNMVQQMHPKLRQKFADFFSEVEKKTGYTILGTSGLRSSAEQGQLSSQNSSNAQAGYSDHEYGFAMDVNVLDKSGNVVLRKASSKAEWIKSGVVDIAKKHGFKWGGDFANYHDPVHFYNDFGIPAHQMLELKNAGKVDNEGYLKV
jgi:hypothetical protein